MKLENIWKQPKLLLIGMTGLLAALFLGASLWPPAGEALGTLDTRALFYPWLAHARNEVLSGRLPFWDPTFFGGYPFLSNPQVAIFYPPTWLAILLPVELGLSLHVWLHLTLAAVGTMLFVHTLRKEGAHAKPQSRKEEEALGVLTPSREATAVFWRSWLGPLLAGLSFGFSGFATVRVYAGHVGLLATHAWLPWLLLATVWSLRRRSAWAGVVAGLPFGLAILAGHTTSLLYVGLVWGCFVLYLLVEEPRSWLMTLRQPLLMGVTGLLLAAVQLVPLLQFIGASARAGEADFAFASAFSLPPAHLITLLVPEFFGEPTRAGYWSVPNFDELTYYVGVLPLLGLILALRKPTKQSVFWLLLGALGLLLALGSYGFLFRLAFEWVPLFRLTRAPGRAAVLWSFGTAVLLGHMITQWQALPAEQRRGQIRGLMRWLVPKTAVVGLTTIAAVGAVFASVHPTDTSGRLWHQLGGWGTALGLLLVGELLVWGLLGSDEQASLQADGQEKLTQRREDAKEKGFFASWGLRVRQTSVAGEKRLGRSSWLAVALVGLVLVDLWGFGSKFVGLHSVTPPPLWQEAVVIIGEPQGRVLPWGISIFDQNGARPAGLESVFGYNALEVGTNTTFAGSVPDPRATTYDILGAAYVLSQARLEQFEGGERPLTLIGQQGGTWVYARARTLPHVRLVGGAEILPDEAALIARVHQPDFDPATTALLTVEPNCQLDGSGTGTAIVEEKAAGRWTIRTQSDGPTLLVVSETAYPGWQVTVDGEQAEALTAYTVNRAVCVPPGEHLVEWRFVPTVFVWGGLLSILGMLLVGVGTAVLMRNDKS